MEGRMNTQLGTITVDPDVIAMPVLRLLNVLVL